MVTSRQHRPRVAPATPGRFSLSSVVRHLLSGRLSQRPRLEPTGPVSAEEFLDLLGRAGLRPDSRAQLIRSFHRRGRWTAAELASINTALAEVEALLGSPIGTVEDASVSLGEVLQFMRAQLKSGC